MDSQDSKYQNPLCIFRGEKRRERERERERDRQMGVNLCHSWKNFNCGCVEGLLLINIFGPEREEVDRRLYKIA